MDLPFDLMVGRPLTENERAALMAAPAGDLPTVDLEPENPAEPEITEPEVDATLVIGSAEAPHGKDSVVKIEIRGSCNVPTNGWSMAVGLVETEGRIRPRELELSEFMKEKLRSGGVNPFDAHENPAAGPPLEREISAGAVVLTFEEYMSSYRPTPFWSSFLGVLGDKPSVTNVPAPFTIPPDTLLCTVTYSVSQDEPRNEHTLFCSHGLDEFRREHVFGPRAPDPKFGTRPSYHGWYCPYRSGKPTIPVEFNRPRAAKLQRRLPTITVGKLRIV